MRVMVTTLVPSMRPYALRSVHPSFSSICFASCGLQSEPDTTSFFSESNLVKLIILQFRSSDHIVGCVCTTVFSRFEISFSMSLGLKDDDILKVLPIAKSINRLRNPCAEYSGAIENGYSSSSVRHICVV